MEKARPVQGADVSTQEVEAAKKAIAKMAQEVWEHPRNKNPQPVDSQTLKIVSTQARDSIAALAPGKVPDRLVATFQPDWVCHAFDGHGTPNPAGNSRARHFGRKNRGRPGLVPDDFSRIVEALADSNPKIRMGTDHVLETGEVAPTFYFEEEFSGNRLQSNFRLQGNELIFQTAIKDKKPQGMP